MIVAAPLEIEEKLQIQNDDRSRQPSDSRPDHFTGVT